MVVSNKFPLKVREKESPINKFRWKSVETKNAPEHPSPQKCDLLNEDKKRKPPLPVLPEIKPRSSRRRKIERKGLMNEINPW